VSLLAIRNLHVRFGDRTVVDGIDLDVGAGEIHGLAGESGSGKTVTSLAVLGLVPPNARVSGSIRLGADGDAVELVGATRATLARVRGRRIAMVFQDPSTALHPQLSVGRQLTDHVRHHLGLDRAAAKAHAIELLERVQIPDAASALRRYPHQFSGGQRQRIAIAVALACEPAVLLADEPTTALDVTVQAGILRLLRSLVDESGLGVLLVTHDLGVMSAVADRVSVMRNGSIVESQDRAALFASPRHDYTRQLLAALPGSPLEEVPDEL
jgi:ABC-type microcin C transport system duplicated ATPase subunit YejF